MQLKSADKKLTAHKIAIRCNLGLQQDIIARIPWFRGGT